MSAICNICVDALAVAAVVGVGVGVVVSVSPDDHIV